MTTMTKPLAAGVDIHTGDTRTCWRCMMDTSLYGESLWDTGTMVHLNPSRTTVRADGTYSVWSPPNPQEFLEQEAEWDRLHAERHASPYPPYLYDWE